MPDDLPDRLSNNPRSPFFKEEVLRHDIGIRFNGAEKTNVEEYCISEGWIRVEVGKTKDRYGNPMTVRLNGKVEPYFKDIDSEAKPEAKSEAETKPAAQPKPAKDDKPEKAAKPAEKEAKPAKAEKAGKAKPEKKKAKPEKKKAKKK